MSNGDHRENSEKDVELQDLKSLKGKFRQLQKDHRKLIAVTSELTLALQQNIMGQTKNLQNVLDQCNVIYPSLFVSQREHHEGKSTLDEAEYDDLRNEQLHCLELTRTQEAPKVEHLDLENVQCQNEEENIPTVSITEREIRDILDIVLTKTVQYLTEDSSRREAKDCCESGRACTPCRKEIFRIVETILTKVTESPRFKMSPRNSPATRTTQTQTPIVLCQDQYVNRILLQTEDDLIPKSSHVPNKNTSSKLQSLHKTELNFDSIKDNLRKGTDEEKIAILRDLRRDLTKTDKHEALKILDEYILQDVLDIKRKCPSIEIMLQVGSTLLKEQVFRLINAIASFQRGRCFLVSDNVLLKSILVPVFMKKCTQTCRAMLAASLQKISLQRQARAHMIKEGLLDYLVEFLGENHGELSLYCLESCLALLMNLCADEEGKRYCGANPKKVVDLLRQLLENPQASYVPYISGTLLNLLAQSDINVEARKQSLDRILSTLSEGTDNEQIRRQLRYVISVRFAQQLRLFIGDDDAFSEQNDVLEAELDTDLERELEEMPDAETVHKKADTGLLKREAPNFGAPRQHNFSRLGRKPGKEHTATDDKKRTTSRGVQDFPKISFCYLEICQSIHDGSKTCRCLKCSPDRSRYSCGCYDIICSEIAEEIGNICRSQDVAKTKYVKKESTEDGLEMQENIPHNRSGSRCNICGDKTCDCAFESRPKIHRTPPKT